MKSITISIYLLLVLAINSNAQNCMNTTTLSGVGGQSAQSLIKNECSYLWGDYGFTKQGGYGMSHSFTVDGHTFHRGAQQGPDGENFTPFICKLNPDNSLAWFLHASKSYSFDLGIVSIHRVQVDDHNNVYILISRSYPNTATINMGSFSIPYTNNCNSTIVKLNPAGNLIWQRSFSGCSDFRIDINNNPVLLLDLGPSSTFWLDTWDSETEYLTGEWGYNSTFRLVTFSTLDGSYLGQQSLSQYGIGVKTTDCCEFGTHFIESNGTLSISHMRSGDEILLAYPNNIPTLISNNEQRTKFVLKSPYSGYYYRFCDDGDGVIIEKWNQSFTDTIVTGRFRQLLYSFDHATIDENDNIVFTSKDISNRTDDRGTYYNGQSMNVPERGNSNSERLVYLDSTLNLIGQSYLRYQQDYCYVGYPQYCPSTQTIKSIGMSNGTPLENSTAMAFPADYNKDIAIYEFDHSLIFPKLDNVTLINKNNFTLKKGETKEMSAEFYNKEALTIEWLIDGEKVATGQTFTVNAENRGHFLLTLKAYNPENTEKTYEKHWRVSVTDLQAEYLFENTHPLYTSERDVSHIALDSIHNALWAISTYNEKVYYINMDSLPQYKMFDKPVSINMNNKRFVSVITDDKGDLWMLSDEGDLITCTDTTNWQEQLTADLNINGEPTQLYCHKGEMYISTSEGLYKKVGEQWQAVPNISLTSPYIPAYVWSTWPLPSSDVECMGADNNGELWLGLEPGIMNLSVTDSLFPQSHGAPINHVYAITASGDKLYFGTAINGVIEYDIQTKEVVWLGEYSEYQTYHESNVRYIKTDNYGNLWWVNANYGSGSGLFCYEPDKKRFTHHINNTNVSYRFEIDNNNQLYFIDWGRIKTASLPKPNTAPIASATAPGQALKVFEGKTIQLKGDGSYDADGDELTYKWSVPGFDEYCTFSNANAANPTVTLMLPPKPADYPEDAMYGEYYTIQLVVSDGIDSDTATLGVAVKANELPPVISVANDWQLEVNEGETLLIDASASYDPETSSLYNCTFEWKLKLDNKETTLESDSSKLYLVAPYVADYITAKLYVKATDGKNESEWYEVDVDIHNIVPFAELNVSLNGSPFNMENYVLFFLNEDTKKGIQEIPNEQNRYVLPEGRWKIMAVPTKPETDNFIITFAPGSAIVGDAHIFDLNEDSEVYTDLRIIPFGLTNGSGTISGKAERQIAVNEGGDIDTVPLFSNNIVIYSLPDTIPVTTCMTNDQGEYTVQNLNWGKYLVVPSYLGISFDNGIDVELSVENASAVNIDFLLGIATSINSPEEITKLRVYPNPVQDIIWVKGINKSLNYKIYSINGNCLRTGTTVSSINIEELNKGIYLLELETSSIRQMVKIIKQ